MSALKYEINITKYVCVCVCVRIIFTQYANDFKCMPEHANTYLVCTYACSMYMFKININSLLL